MTVDSVSQSVRRARRSRRAVLALTGAVLAAASTASAHTAPGESGRLTFSILADGGVGDTNILDPLTGQVSPGMNSWGFPDDFNGLQLRTWDVAWAPRGGRIAVTSWPCPVQNGSPQDCEAEDLFTANPDGSGIQRLTQTPSDQETDPDWSPTGKQLAYVRAYPYFWDNPGLRPAVWEIWLRQADGSEPKRLSAAGTATDVDPSWSPDGTKIAFSSQRNGNSEIYVMNSDGTNQTRLTHDADADTEPTWSPDGEYIAWVDTSDGDEEIWRMRANGTDVVQLTTNGVRDMSPAWSPDGSRIAFVSYRQWHPLDFGDGTQLMTMNPDGSGEEMHTKYSHGVHAGNPSWERINRAPTASLSIATATPRVGAAVTLAATADDSDGSVAAIDWDLDQDGAFDDATGESASVTPTQARAYRIGVRVTDDEGALAFTYADFAAAAAPASAGTPVPGGGVLGEQDRAAPSVAFTFNRRGLGVALRRGLPVRLQLGEAASIVVAAHLTRTAARRMRLPGAIARAATTVRGPGTSRVTLRFTRRARRRLDQQQRVQLVIRIAATDAAGNVRRRSSRIVLYARR
jgi:hypothetical protein